MNRLTVFVLTAIFALATPSTVFAQNVVEDGGVGLGYDELAYVVKRWTPQMQSAAADDLGDRLELLTVTLANKKIAREAEQLSAEADGDEYWDYVFEVQAVQRKFIMNRFAESIEVPDMAPLAQERYETQKEKYALVPEQRISSHILFSCPPGQCSRGETRAKAQVVLDKLRAGADFADMVLEYSDDPSTRAKGGKFDKWMGIAEPQVARPYSDGLFEIEEKGQYSELVSTQYGIHILRLDDVREAYFKSYDEVKGKIIADLELEYRKLALKDYLAQFNISDEAYIDGKAMEAIFAPYKSSAASEAGS